MKKIKFQRTLLSLESKDDDAALFSGDILLVGFEEPSPIFRFYPFSN